MLTLEELNAKTSSIFDGGVVAIKPQIPVPPQIWKDRIEALSSANLVKQRASCIFDMRCWQAEAMGFQQLSSGKMVEMLMGGPHTETYETGERQVHEWVYNHHTDETWTKKESWGGIPITFVCKERTGLWCYPPFSMKQRWACRFGKLDYLKRDIPYGVVLRINECKELKLFNVFNVLAPIEAWERKTDIDPIVVATIWEMPPMEGEEQKTSSAGQAAHFFLAQW